MTDKDTLFMLVYLLGLVPSFMLCFLARTDWVRAISDGREVTWLTRCHPQLSVANWQGMRPTRAPNGDDLLLFLPCFLPLANLGYALAIFAAPLLTPRYVGAPDYRPPFRL